MLPLLGQATAFAEINYPLLYSIHPTNPSDYSAVHLTRYSDFFSFFLKI
jgi:hypothetical protein